MAAQELGEQVEVADVVVDDQYVPAHPDAYSMRPGAPPEEVDVVATLAGEIMEAALPLAVPIVVDVKIGSDWSEV